MSEESVRRSPREALGRRPRTRTGFGTLGFGTLGHNVLKLNVDALVSIYDKTIAVVDTMMKGGKANSALSFFGTLIYGDLLHGGAYACPINQRPFYKTGSRFDPGPLGNLPKEALLDWITGLFAGTGAKPTALFDEVLINANCPHIFPKLLSDEAFGLLKLALAYQGGVNLFQDSAKGLATLVEAESHVIAATGQAAAGIGTGVQRTIGTLAPLLSSLAPVA